MNKKILAFFICLFLLGSMLPIVNGLTIRKNTEYLVGSGKICKNDEPYVEWNTSFGTNKLDEGYCVRQTSDGGYTLVGLSDTSCWLIKTDSNGNKIWDKRFGADETDWGSSVRQTSDGGYIIAGATESYTDGVRAAWLIKTDSNGNKIWDKTYGGYNSEKGYSVQQTSDNGYILAGVTYSYGAGKNDAWLVKTDASGNKLWDKTFGGAETDEVYSIQETTDNGYIMTGYTESYGAGEMDAWLIKTDSNGNKIWDKTFGGADNYIARSVKQTSDGGYIIGGYMNPPTDDIANFLIIKTDADGNKIWEQTFGGERSERAYTVELTSDGGYLLAGTRLGGGFSKHVWLVKTDANGNKLWDQQSLYRAPSAQEGYSLQRTSDNGYIITGVTLVYYPDDEYYSDDILLLKLSGNQAPETPSKPSGPSNGEVGTEYTYTTSTTDPEGYKIYYNFSWGDGTYSGWLGAYNSGETASGSHIWEWQGSFYIKVKAKDDPNNDGDLSDGAESGWSETTSARMPKNKEKTLNTQLSNFLQNHPILYQLLQRCLQL